MTIGKTSTPPSGDPISITIEVPGWAIGWFQTFVGRSYFDTFKSLAENFDEDEAYLLRNAVHAVNDAITKARGQQ